MKLFSRIAYLIFLLLALLIVPAVHAQNPSDQILYAVSDKDGDKTIYTVNADDGVKNQIGSVHGDGNHAGWSPDGKFIYLLDSTTADKKGLVQRTLTLVDAETHQRQTLPDFLEGSWCSLPILWSPHDEWVAYSTYSDSQILLKLFNSTTGNTQTVATLHSSYNISELGWSAALNWSSDECYLSYDDYEPDNYHVTIYDVQNQQTVDVLDGLLSYNNLYWSPTENILVYSHKSSAIVHNLVDGTKQQYEAKDIGQWSPDGRFLTVYNKDENGHKILSVIDVHANKIIGFKAEIAKLGFNTQVAWSPDGHFLAVASFEKDSDYKGTVSILDVVKGSSSRLKIEPYITDEFRWSSTGHQLIFASNPVAVEGGENYTSLWWFDIDHQQSHLYNVKISTNFYYYGQTFDWFADGAYALVQTNSGLMLLDKSSQTLSPIGDTAQLYDLTRWWTNGTRIALSSNDIKKGDIYILKPESNTLRNITNTPDEIETFLGWRGVKDAGETLSFCGEG